MIRSPSSGRAAWLVLLVGMSSCAPAAPGADLVIRRARVLLETGRVLDPATVVVDGGRITRVAAGEDPSRGREELDAGGMTVIPGLIDSGARLLPGAGMGDRVSLERFIREDLPGRLENDLFRGVTTVVCLGDPWPAIRDVRQRVASGTMAGPRILAVGPALVAKGTGPAPGACAGAPWLRPQLCREVAGPAEARAEVRRQAEEGVDGVAVIPPGAAGTSGLSPEAVAAVAQEAHRLGLPVMVRGSPTPGETLALVETGVDVLARPPTGCGDAGAKLAAVLREGDLPVTTGLGALAAPDASGAPSPRGAAGEPGRDAPDPGLEAAGACLRFLAAQAVPLLAGSSGAPLAGRSGLLREMGRLHAAGLTAEEIVSAATKVPGRIHPLLRDAGVMEPGRRADFVLLEGDPHRDLGALARVKVVILEGRIVVDKRPR